MLGRWEQVKMDMEKGYETYLFHKVYHKFYNFVISDLSAFYLDILWDRLYTHGKNSLERRSAQTVISKILRESIIIFSPILSFTTEEVWQYLKNSEESIFLADMPDVNNDLIDNSLMEDFQNILKIREDVLIALEKARNKGLIGNSLEARIVINSENKILKKYERYLPEIFIVSQVEFGDVNKADVVYNGESGDYGVSKASGKKCERCWVYSETVGMDNKHPSLCKKCVEVIEKEDYDE